MKDTATSRPARRSSVLSGTVWWPGRQQAEFVGNYIGKGRLVLVEGKLQTRKWQGQDGQDRYTTEIVADNISGLDRAAEGQFNQAGQQGGYQQNNNYQQGGQKGGYQQPPQQASLKDSPMDIIRMRPEEDLGPAFPSEASGMDDVLSDESCVRTVQLRVTDHTVKQGPERVARVLEGGVSHPLFLWWQR